MATTAPISLPSLRPPPIINRRSSLLFTSHLSFSTTNFSSRKPTLVHNRQKKSNKLWVSLATPEDQVLPSDSAPLDDAQQIVSATGDEGVATVIQALLFVAFVALAVLTIGVIYIAVQDFLEKREREKFEKEEAGNNNGGKKKKKKVMRARAGPRGFGQKVDEDDDTDF